MKTGMLYFTTCFHGFGILRHVDPFVRMLHIYKKMVLFEKKFCEKDFIEKSAKKLQLFT